MTVVVVDAQDAVTGSWLTMIKQEELRKQAEEKVALLPKNSEPLSSNAAQLMLHELRVHQVQLEMQNEELRVSQAERDAIRMRYFELYELAPMGYVTITGKGVILEMNLIAASLLKVIRGESYAWPFAKFVFTEDSDNFYLLRQQLLTTGKLQERDLRMVKRDGTLFWAHLSVSLANNSADVSTMLIAFLDITSRKQVEADLRESEERFARLAEQCGTFVWDVDAQGLYTYVSPVVEKVLGYRPEELIGRLHFYDLHPEVDRETYKAKTLAVFQRKEEFTNFVNMSQKRDGRVVWLETTGQPLIDANGRLLGYRGFDADITERKNTEEELQKIDKLQSIGVLAGGIAHDFNNILQGLYGNISFAKEDLPKKHPSHEFLEEAEKSMTRAVWLTKQLLTFAKGGAPIKETINISPLIEETARFDLSGSNVKLAYHHAADLWPVDADKGQIRQVVSNLVINACEAMPNGGNLSITLKNTDLTANAVSVMRPGRYVRVVVKDDGKGLAAETINKIFDPYFTTKHFGNGLGLTTVWSIITKHGGHIEVVSELGKGAAFTFYLPASTSLLPAEAKPPVEVIHPLPKFAKVLVMDDEEMICDLVVKMLTSNGYFVAPASGARETVALYKQALEEGTPFDLVILDLTIPGEPGGKEVIKDLQILDPKVKAIVTSGYADNFVMINPTAYGFKGAIVKPYISNDLLKIVSKILNKG